MSAKAASILVVATVADTALHPTNINTRSITFLSTGNAAVDPWVPPLTGAIQPASPRCVRDLPLPLQRRIWHTITEKDTTSM
jgi:hypothetical protein